MMFSPVVSKFCEHIFKAGYQSVEVLLWPQQVGEHVDGVGVVFVA
jgi:hypothetical protein